jgi:tol-pal system protein YbgF
LRKTAFTALLLAAWSICAAPAAYGVSKETLQMMQQLDALTQAVQNLQKTVDTQTAVLKTLIEQTADNVNSMKVEIDAMRKSTETTLASSNARFDTLTGQIQALSESLEESKARLAKLSEQLAQTQNIIQTLSTPPATGQPTTGTGTPANPQPAKPDADSLYKSGMSNYNAGQYDLAVQSFQDYLKYYGDTDQASTAQYYIGDCYYSQKNYEQAVDEFNKCLERYPKGNKLAAAQLKKGYALLALNQKSAGVRELRSLVQRFPKTPEADLAAQRLRKLGVPVRAR